MRTEYNFENAIKNPYVQKEKRQNTITLNCDAKSSFECIYDVVKQIPHGKVATYGQVAALAENKRLSYLRQKA